MVSGVTATKGLMKSEKQSAFLAAYVPPAMRAELTRLAAANDRSVSAELRAAIRLHLRINEKEKS
jgi:hypothetical protein